MNLVNKIKEHTADSVLSTKLQALFEELFHYDEHSVSPAWTSEEHLDGVFNDSIPRMS
jgi:hypothetical protein